MQMMKKLMLLPVVGLGIIAAVCGDDASLTAVPQAEAKFTTDFITVDGKLTEAAWKTAPAYDLALPRDTFKHLPVGIVKTIGEKMHEGGSVKMLWDKDYLYIGATLEDSDVMNMGNENQSHFYTSGDVLEVFLKPAGKNYYWEIYGTPNSKKTWFFYPSRGRIVFPFAGEFLPKDLQVAAMVDGTFNDYSDRDKGWTIEIAIPIKELAAKGVPFDNSGKWTVEFGRYNYSAHLERQEQTAFPLLTQVNFHIYEEFANLKLITE